MKSTTNRLFPFANICAGAEHFALTFGADAKGNIWIDAQSQWAGFADEAGKIEIRRLRLVHPRRMGELWRHQKQPFMVVNDTRSFARWFVSGGNALVQRR
jgi:hypothetical protein